MQQSSFKHSMLGDVMIDLGFFYSLGFTHESFELLTVGPIIGSSETSVLLDVRVLDVCLLFRSRFGS